MDVLGVDQSLTMTGLARRLADAAVETSRIPTVAPENPNLASTRARVRYITGGVLKFAPQHCLSVIESPYIPRHNAGAVLDRAWLFGILVDQLMIRGPVAQVRTKTRAKYATGNGNADKAEVLAAMRERFPELTIADDNEADALALLSMGARFLGTPIDGAPTPYQLKAMTAVAWPDLRRSK
jgi:Holliday junction resolvasome RuvABC endonuclease subunit